jgi:hypothetical protein
MEIAVDFDGTCVSHEFPNIGKDIGAVPVLRKLVEHGHKLILWTMRDNKPNRGIMYLSEAEAWFKENDIPLFGVQRNPEQDLWTRSPKAYAHIYIDDAAAGCPLKCDTSISKRPFVDWTKMRDLLENKGCFDHVAG